MAKHRLIIVKAHGVPVGKVFRLHGAWWRKQNQIAGRHLKENNRSCFIGFHTPVAMKENDLPLGQEICLIRDA